MKTLLLILLLCAGCVPKHRVSGVVTDKHFNFTMSAGLWSVQLRDFAGHKTSGTVDGRCYDTLHVGDTVTIDVYR
jgi:hypothetical protein